MIQPKKPDTSPVDSALFHILLYNNGLFAPTKKSTTFLGYGLYIWSIFLYIIGPQGSSVLSYEGSRQANLRWTEDYE